VDEQEAGTPDVEIVVKVDGRETAIVAFFADGHGGYEYVAGIEHEDLKMLVAEILAQASPVVRTSAFTHYVVPPVGPLVEENRTDDPFPF